MSAFQSFSFSPLIFLPLAWLWFTVINHLRVEWAVNPQYAYGWAVPFLCLYLLGRKAESRKQKVEIGVGKTESLKSSEQRTEEEQKAESRKQKSEGAGGKAEIPVPFSFSAFQRFSFSLLSFLYLPTRLIQEANPEWRLVSWALAIEVVGITLLLLRTTDHGPRTPDHVSRYTFPFLFFLVAVPWPTFIEAPLVQGLMRANIGVTTELLSAFGVPAVRHGNVIQIATGLVGIDDACNGIRSFQATLMISLFLGELYRLSVLRRSALCLLGFALSFLFNVARTTLLTWVAAHKGIAAIASWHDPAGVTILVACFVCLWLIARALRKVESRKQTVESGGEKAEGTGGEAEKLKSETLKSSAQEAERKKQESEPGPACFQYVSFSAFQRLSIFLTVWLLLVEAGTELWYRSHEWRVPPATTWQVEFPRDNATFRELPFTDKTRQFLRYDEGYNGTWQEGPDQRWQAIFFRWNPGRIAVHLAKSHTPEVCLTAAGRELVSQSGLRPVAVHGLRLPFRSYVVKDENGPLHVFYCLWDDRANTQSFRTTAMTYANRLAPVLAGRRNSGQRSLEVAISGIPDQQKAEAALAQELEKLIKVERPADH